MTGERPTREREHFNESVGSDARLKTDKWYAAARASTAFYERNLLSDCEDRAVLEVGTGTGTFAFKLAARGAAVIAFDISDSAVALAARYGRMKEGRLNFAVADAHEMAFPGSTFDLVCGGGVLHHVDVARTFAEVVRVLRPDGRAVFVEPLGHNPLIDAYRRLTPNLRTPDEQPLSIPQLDAARRHFSNVELHFFHLTSLAAVAVLRLRVFPWVLHTLERLDTWRMRWSWARRMSWIVVLTCEGPRAATDAASAGVR